MGERPTNKYKIVLDALTAVEGYASVFGIEEYQDIEAFSKAEETLVQHSFPREVRGKVKSVAHTILQKIVSTVKFLKNENQEKIDLLKKEYEKKIEVLEAENKRNIERLKEDSRQKGEQVWRRIWKGVILLLYVLIMFGMYWKENGWLLLLCIPVSFVEHLLLNDTFAARLWAWILTKAKNIKLNTDSEIREP